MQPVRLRFCGFQLTRRGYLTVQCVLMLVLAVLIVVLYKLASRAPTVGASPWQILVTVVVRNLYWIVPLALVLDGIEVLLVLRRFADKEALERKRQSL
jgi:hypothetical protein